MNHCYVKLMLLVADRSLFLRQQLVIRKFLKYKEIQTKIHFYSLYPHKNLSQYFMKIRNSIAHAKIEDRTCKKIIFSPDGEPMVKLSQKGLTFIEDCSFLTSYISIYMCIGSFTYYIWKKI